MMKFFMLFVFSTLLIYAGEDVKLPAYAVISALIVVIVLFFWGVFKAVQTQRLVYAWALLPFTALLFWMFFS
ncbi:MAG TPA: hypothetical protein ENJ71_05000 [Epsilonproteobacteria bacterium]|nr:hypothetical protein [Campylobacterota bacterium]